MKTVSIRASGMVTAVGATSAATCAAIRAGIDGFAETHFVDGTGEPIRGASVPLESPVRGREKLVELASAAIAECLQGIDPEKVPLMLCVAEKGRPGRLCGLDDRLLPEIEAKLQTRFHPKSCVLAGGRVGGVHAIEKAQEWPACLVAGVDSFLVAGTLSSYDEQERLVTSWNSNGFLPGEAAAAVLLAAPQKGPELVCRGVGFGQEKATILSEEPLRADGLLEAVRNTGIALDQVDYRIADLSGEQYGFKEAALLVGRALRKKRPSFPLWHPADCLGEVGAAIVPCVLGVALAAARKRYAPGTGVLCHFGNDDGSRAAIALRYGE